MKIIRKTSLSAALNENSHLNNLVFCIFSTQKALMAMIQYLLSGIELASFVVLAVIRLTAGSHGSHGGLLNRFSCCFR